jgi:hypothetical protein
MKNVGSHQKTLQLSLALVALAVGCAPQALAATVPFTYRRGGIPDFDQRRQIAGGHFGLPNNGSQYCVPTSAMDCLAYVANHGYGWMAPNGYRNWQSQSLYDSAGIEIWNLGTVMNTDPNAGTTGGDHVQGIKDWLDSWGLLSDFTVAGTFASGTFCPSPNDLADAAFQGGLVMPVVGWYSLMAGQYTRVGGHCLAMNKLVGAAGPTYTISWRDPASDDGVYTTQSSFSTDTYSLMPVAAMFGGQSRTQFRVVGYNSGTNAGFLEGFIVITPKYALTSAPGDLEFDLYAFGELTGGFSRPAHVAAFGGIHHAALHSSMSSIAYLTRPYGGPQGDSWNDLRVLDPVSGASVLIQNQIDHAVKIAVSRNRRAYVLDQYGIRVLGHDLDHQVDPYVGHMPQYMNTLACDDLYDLVYVLCTTNTRLVQCSANLGTQIDVQLPAGLSINADAPMFVSPVTSNVWIASQWASELYELGIDANGVATLLSQFYDPNLFDAIGLSVDDREHVFVSTLRGTGLEFAGGTGNWQRVSPSVLDGKTFGKVIALSFSRSNFDPATMTGPAYVNVLPTDFAPPEHDTTGDLNCDGAVNFGDINPLVLALTGPAGYHAAFPNCNIQNGDVNTDGVVDFGDINPFVALLAGSG